MADERGGAGASIHDWISGSWFGCCGFLESGIDDSGAIEGWL